MIKITKMVNYRNVTFYIEEIDNKYLNDRQHIDCRA